MSKQEHRSVEEELDDGSYVFSRESLCDEAIVQYVAELVEESVDIAVTPLNVQMLIQSRFQTQGAICLYEISTAMDEFVDGYSCPKKRVSTRMKNDISRFQYEQHA